MQVCEIRKRYIQGRLNAIAFHMVMVSTVAFEGKRRVILAEIRPKVKILNLSCLEQNFTV